MTAQTILPANSAASGGFEVANSLRFNRASSDYLSRATNVTGTNTKYTLSFWIKLCDIANFQRIFEVYKASNERVDCGFNLDNTLQPRFVIQEYTGSYIYRKIFTRLLRDVAAWTHYVIKFDSSESEANRLKVYINGVEETATDQANLPADGATSIISVGTQHIGYSQNNSGHHLNGYLAEFVLIEGTDYAPTSFGEFDEDSGIWKPIDVSGLTFGTNGFYLDFEESGTSANSSGLGADKSGNDHHFTVNNLTAVDQSTDTCTNNFATLNPLRTQAGYTKVMSEGNCVWEHGQAGQNASITSTIAASSGKWYAEFLCSTNANNWGFGIAQVNVTNNGSMAGYPDSQGGVTYVKNGNLSWYAGGDESSDTGTTFATDDIIAILMDLDNTRVYWYKNDTLVNSGGFDYSVVNSGSTLENNYYFMAGSSDGGTDPVLLANFGSPPHAITSGNTDGNGYGNFEFATKGGYALNTKNLAEYG